MSYQAKIKRYVQICQLLEKSKYPTIAEMLTRINDSGIKLAERQLRRDLESLRVEFGLDIQYSSVKKGYYLQNEEEAFPYFLKLLEFSQNIDLLQSYLKDGAGISDIIEFEGYSSFKGLQYIREIASSIQHTTETRLVYKRFDLEVTKSYKFEPYLLREYMNRWYVIGYLSETREIRTFGLDRIVDFQDLGIKFRKSGKNAVVSLFENVVGINACEGTMPEEIELVCNLYLGKLLQTLPLHESQRVIKVTDDEITLSFKLVINLELKQRLLMMATQSRVAKPQKLKEEMLDMMEEARNSYLK
jgi:predicted DNA-binding transcriptional regulator YafY